MKAPPPKEAAMQRSLIELLDLALPPHAIAFAIPGGDGRATRTPGYKAGFPDVGVITVGRIIVIELKRGKLGRVSAEQSAMHNRLTLCGAVVIVARTIDEVFDRLTQLIPGMKRVQL